MTSSSFTSASTTEVKRAAAVRPALLRRVRPAVTVVPIFAVLLVVHWRNSIAALRANEVPPDLGYSLHASLTLQLVQASCLALLCGWFSYAVLNAAPRRWPMREVAWNGAAMALMAGCLLPANSSDVLEYIGFGRLVAIYHLNPYTHTYSEVSDAVSRQITWDEPMPYGPLLIPIFALAGRVSQFGMTAAIYLLKSVWVLAWSANAYLVVLLAEGFDLEPSLALFSVVANPLVLFEQIGNAHNDGILVLFTLLSIWCLQKKRHRTALVCAAASAMVKAPGMFVLAGVAILLARERRWRALLEGSIVTAAGTLALDWIVPGSFDPLLMLNRQWPYSEDSLHTLVVNLRPHQWDYDEMFGVDRFWSAVLFVAFVVWRYTRVRDLASCVRELCRVLLALLLFYAASVYPWYLAWVVPLAALTDDAGLRRTTLVAGTTLLLLYAVPQEVAERLPWHRLWAALRICVAFLPPVSVWALSELHPSLLQRARTRLRRDELAPAGPSLIGRTGAVFE